MAAKPQAYQKNVNVLPDYEELDPNDLLGSSAEPDICCDCYMPGTTICNPEGRGEYGTSVVAQLYSYWDLK